MTSPNCPRSHHTGGLLDAATPRSLSARRGARRGLAGDIIARMTKAVDTAFEHDGRAATFRELVDAELEPKALVAVLHALPIALALRILGELEAELDASVEWLVDVGGLDLGGSVSGVHAAWAEATLDALADAADPDLVLALFALLAIARAGRAVEPRWERLVPSHPGSHKRAHFRPYVFEIAGAVPPERAFEVGLAVMAREPVNAAGSALSLLRAHDDEALAERLLAAESAGWPPERLRSALEKIADGRPNISRALAKTAP